MNAKELRVTVHIRNNRLMRAREDRGMTREQLGKAAGVSDSTIAGLETIRVHPHHIRRGGWKPSALRLASFFGVAPEELFPDSVLAVAESKKTVEVDGRDVARLMPPDAMSALPSSTNIESDAIDEETRRDLERCVESLPARRARVLRLYYGLGDEEPHTLNEIGESWPGAPLSRERVRQLREEGLAELRRVMKR